MSTNISTFYFIIVLGLSTETQFYWIQHLGFKSIMNVNPHGSRFYFAKIRKIGQGFL